MAGSINADATRPDNVVKDFLSVLPEYIAAMKRIQDALTDLTKKSVGSLIYNYQKPTNASAYHEAGMTFAGSPTLRAAQAVTIKHKGRGSL
ncbi:MAG TPA: hypothetical protein VGL22_03730 [Terracidiphilus sp.]